MALGNANSSAQSRGKNKPVIVKFHKERVLGKGFTSYSSSAPHPTSGDACTLKNPKMQTYYHNGSGTVPVVGDTVYAKPHANKRYILSAGNYQVLDGKARKSITVNKAGAVTATANC